MVKICKLHTKPKKIGGKYKFRISQFNQRQKEIITAETIIHTGKGYKSCGRAF